jgi:excisionase family DNA binding protein
MTKEQGIKLVLEATPEWLARFETVMNQQTEPAVPPCLRLLKMGEAARETGLSRPTLWRAIRDGHLHAVEIREGSRRIPLAELQRFVTGRKPTGGEA